MKNKPVFFLSVFLLSFQLISQGINSPHDYSISSFSVGEGLSQSTVFAVFQDSDGFIWIGTRGGGLNRFDGYDFDVFVHNSLDSSSLSHNEVLSIFEDSGGSLWVGTRGGGVNLFDRNRKTFLRYSLDAEGSASVKYIFEDNQKNLFLGTYKGLYFKANDADDFELFKTDIDNDLEITSILALDDNTLMIGARSGVYRLTKSSGKLERLFEIATDPTIGGHFNVPLMIDKKNNLWFGTPSGLYVFVDDSLKSTERNPFGIELLNNQQIRTLHKDTNGDVWIGLPTGLVRLNPETGNYLLFRHRANDPKSLPHSSIFSFIEDRDGNLWVGTWGGGVTFLGALPPKFRHFFHIPNSNSLSNNIVSSFAEAENGMWIGTEGGGINHFNTSNGLFTPFEKMSGLSLQTNHIKSLFTDSEGMLWIGTWGAGVYRYNPYTRQYKHFLADARVYSFCEFPHGQMWIGTINGLFRVNFRNNEIISYTENENSAGLKDFFITYLFNDSRGNIWVGTQNGGLHLYNKLRDEFINFSVEPGNPESIIDNYIISIAEGSEGDLWIGTNSGISRYNLQSGSFTNTSMQISLPSMVINGLVLDNQSNLWISTNKGISAYNVYTGLLKNYDVKDGLQSNEFNRGAFFRNRNNQIFFGGINGFNYFNPYDIKINQSPPDVIITGFRLFDKLILPGDETKILAKRISETEEIVLNYAQKVFSLEFVALNYISTEKNRYKYKLEGFSKDWVELGTQRSVSFMNLRDGKYTFRIIASNNDDVWNETGASIKITILPPPWRTNIAFVGYFILLSGMMFFFHRLISWRLKERNRIFNEKLEKERIEELNQMKLKFFTNITHEFKTPLTLITAPLDNLMSNEIPKEKKEYYYKLIKGNIKRLKLLGNQLIDFRKAEQDYYKLSIKQGSLKEFIYKVFESFAVLAENKNINFQVDCVDNDDSRQWFDQEILEKILFNLLSNAFKFTSEGGDICLMMRIDRNQATLSVIDTGIGISPDEIPFVFDRFFTSKSAEKSNYHGSGIGLSFAQKLAEIHHGSIEVKSEKGSSTEFSVTIPVKIESYSSEELSISTRDNTIHKEYDPVYIEPVTIDVAEDEEPGDNSELILVVEDNEEIANYLINEFSDYFKVYRANNGQDGYEMAKELIPDVIISDIMMDKMTGLELCTKLKKDMITSHIPIVLLTVLVSDNNKMDGLEVGADAYVEKPFEIKYLRTVVNNLLKQRALIKEKYLLENIHAAGGVSNNLESKFLTRLEEILNKHYSDPDFSIITLSEKLNVSRSQLFRKFKSVTGKSPSDFIRVVRLKKAAELILRSDLGVNEVAYAVGFNSPSHFITSFKKYFGKTPKEYAISKNQDKAS